MKNTMLLVLLILSSPFVSFAQEFINYGNLSAEEINLKECAFDKDAVAVILLNEAVSVHDDESHLITYHHVRIKILKEKGFDIANVTLQFYRKDDFEFIDMLDAMVTNINVSGQAITENLTKKSFYKQNIDERIGSITFTFPNIKVGSIIEYKYRSFMKHYGGLEDWDFQKRLPVVKSKYTLTILPRAEFAYRINKRDDLQVTARVEKETGRVFFEMSNIPSLTNEPYMDSREDYLQKVIFQLSAINQGYGKKKYMTSWEEVTRELLIEKAFGNQLGKNIPATGAFIDETKKLLSEEDKMKAVYNYVRNNMSWNGFYSKYAGDGVKEPWEKKKGTSGEINLILVNLLKDAGLDAYATLVSERFHGKVNIEYPFVDQFNSVFACVIIKGKKYYLDATDTNTPAHVIPKDILNTTALIVHKKNGGLVTITNDSLQYSDYVNAQMNVDDKGIFSGEVFLKNSGYSRIEKVEDYKDEGKEKYIESHFKKEGLEIKEFEFLNQTSDSLPAEQKFKFSTNLSGSGDYLYVPLNLFFGFERNPFISDSRFSNINFGYKRTVSTYASITLPKNYVLDELPKPVKMRTPDNDIIFTRTVEYDKENNSAVCMFVIEFKKSLYTVDEYPMLQEVYKKMFGFLKEPLVLKKK
jgi:transglutaminase-like putative cysteine protease